MNDSSEFIFDTAKDSLTDVLEEIDSGYLEGEDDIISDVNDYLSKYITNLAINKPARLLLGNH
jgi:hypothetical protein